jgi:16S rRNA C1402 (ribose-2'-O) methylase RsmI
VVRGTSTELADRFKAAPKGEITVVVGADPAPAARVEDGAALEAVSLLVAAGTPRRVAADVVARLTGVSKNTLYRGSL